MADRTGTSMCKERQISHTQGCGGNPGYQAEYDGRRERKGRRQTERSEQRQARPHCRYWRRPARPTETSEVIDKSASSAAGGDLIRKGHNRTSHTTVQGPMQTGPAEQAQDRGDALGLGLGVGADATDGRVLRPADRSDEEGRQVAPIQAGWHWIAASSDPQYMSWLGK